MLIFLSLSVSSKKPTLYAASDASFIVATLNISIGVLSLASSQGLFTVFSFAAQKLLLRIKHPKDTTGEQLGYYEYLKEKENSKSHSIAQFFIVGAFFLLVSIFCATA